MNKILLLAFVVAAASAVPHKNHKALKRPEYDFIDYYDCSGKANGNYMHPSDCTRFITCSNEYASDRACADCNLADNPSQCAGSPYLMWDDSVKRCEWPADTDCKVDAVEPETETPAVPETTTGAPDVPEPTSVEPEIPDPGTGEVCNGVKAGDSCDEDNCEHCGYCRDTKSFYFRCNRTIPSNPKLPITGVIVHEQCDDHLWWNPDLKPGTVAVGGACDEWENLSPAVQDTYNNDPECVKEICEWGQDSDQVCTGNYWYFDPKTHNSGQRDDLSCNGDLRWDPATETCRECTHVAGCTSTC